MIEIASQLGEAALWYAKSGFPVFPLHHIAEGHCSCNRQDCRHAGKHPCTAHGHLDATTDLNRISEWWHEWPDANIGVPTGSPSGWLVVDIDPRNGGTESLERAIAAHGPLPDTAQQITGGGGRHLIFQHVCGVRSGIIAPGIDRKAEGGYIVVSPSETIAPYQWDGLDGEKALLKLAEAPRWATRSTNANSHVTSLEADRIATGARNTTLTSLAGTMRKRGMSESAIVAALIEENKAKCEPPLAEGEIHSIARGVATRYKPAAPRTNAPDDWPEPEPIRSELPPVQAFSKDLLPDSFRPLVADIADRMQVPMDYPAVVVVLCLAGAVNRRAVIQPMANDTSWVVVPNVWGGIIAKPGLMKSPVIQSATRPLNQIQTGWRREHEEALKNFAQEKEEHELRLAAWREEYKKHAKRETAAPQRPEDEPDEPKMKRLIVNDATFEALHHTMSENPAGILVIRDELTGWWSTLDKPGREGERAFCLQAWNGDTGHTIDRIARGTIHVEACCLSMLGGIQPGRLRSYLVDALQDGPSNDGLIQRFQLLVWPDIAREFIEVDRAPDAVSEQQTARVFRKLVELDAENPKRFRFAPDAQELFNEWRSELEVNIRGDELHPALISHLAKYRSLMPSLALLFELADRASSEGLPDSFLADSQNFVNLEHARQAAAWCEYLESHARRVYSCVTTPQLRAARELLEHLKRKQIRNKDGGFDWFTARDVYLKNWTALNSPEAVKQGAEVLEDAGWLRSMTMQDTGGRPGARYLVNPRVWK